jgi:signal transduction histidine kinase
MEHVSAVGRQALSDMRQLIGVLRTESDADLAPPPTTAQLDELVDRLRATGLDVTLERTGEPFELAAVVELSLYRIVQEALTNTLKHSGATTADIVLRYDRPLVALEVLDNGAGAGKSGAGKSGIAPDGHGIEGMRERANLHGGSLSAGPRDSGGWLVTATVVDTTAPSR